MTTTVTIDGVSSLSAVPEAVVVSVRRQLLGGRRDKTVEVPGRPGSWIFREEPGNRNITISLDIQGATFADRRDAVRRLAEWADTPTPPSVLRVDDEPGRYYEVTLVNTPDVDEWLTAGAATLEYGAGPYAFADTPASVVLHPSASPTSSVFAAGAATVVSYPIIEITAIGGLVNAFELTLNGDTLTWHGGALAPVPRVNAPTITLAGTPATNPATGSPRSSFLAAVPGLAIYADGSRFDGFGWQPFLAAGDTITVSSISYTVTLGPNDDTELTGVYDRTTLDMSDVDGRFPLIIPVDNNYAVRWTGPATSLDITLTWRTRYR